MSLQLKDYPCSRCNGSGEITWARHVLSGVCFRCGGSGRQSSKPSIATKWAVLDSAGVHAYNLNARTASEAVKKAHRTYERASAEFQAEHDMTHAVAMLYEEYWTPERLASHAMANACQ